MSDRKLRERPKALTQRLNLTEKRVRALQLLAFPGAVRTAAEDSYVPIDPTAASPAVQATVTSGRWIVIGHTSVSLAASTEWDVIGLHFGVTSPETGLDVAGEMDVFDSALVWQSTYEPSSGHTRWLSLMTSTDVVNPLDQVTVSLLVLNGAGEASTAFTCVRPRLRLIPV